jgi:hypothetical protein
LLSLCARSLTESSGRNVELLCGLSLLAGESRKLWRAPAGEELPVSRKTHLHCIVRVVSPIMHNKAADWIRIEPSRCYKRFEHFRFIAPVVDRKSDGFVWELANVASRCFARR